MNNKKPTSVPQHPAAPRPEGVAKNKGAKPARTIKRKGLSKRLKKEAERYTKEQIEGREVYL